MMRLKLRRTRNSEWLVVTLALLVAAAFATSPAQAVALTVDGSIFFDDFPGMGSVADTTKWPLGLQYATGGSTFTLGGGLLALDSGVDPGIATLDSVTLTFSDNNNWAGQVRFQMTGSLEGSEGEELFTMWKGDYSDRTGARLAAYEDGTGPNGSTFTLGWDGSGIATLNKDQFYELSVLRKPDGNVDIYVDDSLISTQAVMPGDLTTVSPRVRIGDAYSGAVAGHAQFDYLSIGQLVPVPEPSSMALSSTVFLGLLAYARKRR